MARAQSKLHVVPARPDGGPIAPRTETDIVVGATAVLHSGSGPMTVEAIVTGADGLRYAEVVFAGKYGKPFRRDRLPLAVLCRPSERP